MSLINKSNPAISLNSLSLALLFILSLFLTPVIGNRRVFFYPDSYNKIQQTTSTDTDKVFTVVDKYPEFPGGIDALGRFLTKNVRYPASAREHNIQGNVVVNFVIEKDGSVTNAHITHRVDTTLDAEAIRAVNLSPRWSPGMQKGVPVRVSYSLPISFTLSGDFTPPPQNNYIESIPPTVLSATGAAIPDKLPQFPGGGDAFETFLSKNIRYPAVARENGVQGVVKICFVVETNGALSAVHVTSGIGDGCDEEALRVIRSSPQWVPAMHQNRAVRTLYEIPIVFGLGSNRFMVTGGTGSVFLMPDKYPEFPGGINALNSFFILNVKRPAGSRSKKIQGTVMTEFAIDTDGTVSDIHILKTLSGGFDEEASRVLQLSPKWLPAIFNGRAVKSSYQLPISFTTDNGGGITVSTMGAGFSYGQIYNGRNPYTGTEPMLSRRVSYSPVLPMFDTSAVKDIPPIYVLDGKQVSNTNSLDPHDIKSVTVAKDLATTGANNAQPGQVVIFIATRKSGGEATASADLPATPGTDPAKIFTSIDVYPEFPGGLDAFGHFLSRNIIYPVQARRNGTQGRVIVNFVVEKDGSLSDIKVIRGIGDGCDEEAVRVMKLSPKWTPGTQKGVPVRCSYSVPISFTLGN